MICRRYTNAISLCIIIFEGNKGDEATNFSYKIKTKPTTNDPTNIPITTGEDQSYPNAPLPKFMLNKRPMMPTVAMIQPPKSIRETSVFMFSVEIFCSGFVGISSNK